jgi:hypothetical protein
MKVIRFGLITLAALFLVGAVTSFIVLFDRIETTTTVLAGAATACAFLAYALLLKERAER